MIQKARDSVVGINIKNFCNNYCGREEVGKLAGVRVLVKKDVGKDMLTIWSTISIASEDDEEHRANTSAKDHQKSIQVRSEGELKQQF